MIKVAVTGHMSGIGQACYNHFDSIGFSRRNGYNVNQPQNIINNLDDANVFINSAHGGFGQAKMLKAVFYQWQFEEKHIINLGVSKVDVRSWELVHETYSVEKLASHAMCDQLQQLERKCRITNLCLGPVENYNGSITYENITDTISYIINRPYEIKRISM